MVLGWYTMESYTFRFKERDAYGCTALDKYTFKTALGLNANKPVLVKRPDGKTYPIDALRCVARGETSYQLDLTPFKISPGAIVTFWPEEEKNHVFVTVVEPSEVMWEKGAVVDAITDLQRRVDELEAEVL